MGGALAARGSKRGDLLRGALSVFSRDGYCRASVDAIAEAAGVSTRTFYKQFGDKAGLFEATLLASASWVAQAQLAIIARRFAQPPSAAQLEAVLIAFAEEWLAPMPDFDAHFALVRQINAERAHIPASAHEAWQRSGPLKVRKALAERFEVLKAAGLLSFDDPMLAALHFGLLVSATVPWSRANARTRSAIAHSARTGVRAFLRGHR